MNRIVSNEEKFRSPPFRDRYSGCMFEIQANKMLEWALLHRRSVFKFIFILPPFQNEVRNNSLLRKLKFNPMLRLTNRYKAGIHKGNVFFFFAIN